MLVVTGLRRDAQISKPIHVHNMRISRPTYHPSCKNESMKLCATVWLSNVHLSFQSRHWKIDHQRSGSWEWHR